MGGDAAEAVDEGRRLDCRDSDLDPDLDCDL